MLLEPEGYRQAADEALRGSYALQGLLARPPHPLPQLGTRARARRRRSRSSSTIRPTASDESGVARAWLLPGHDRVLVGADLVLEVPQRFGQRRQRRGVGSGGELGRIAGVLGFDPHLVKLVVGRVRLEVAR